MIDYGSVTKKAQYQAGKQISSMTVFTQSITVHSDDEVLEVFKDLLALRSSGSVHNPSISLEEYTDTGKLKRIIKSWSVYED